MGATPLHRTTGPASTHAAGDALGCNTAADGSMHRPRRLPAVVIVVGQLSQRPWARLIDCHAIQPRPRALLTAPAAA